MIFERISAVTREPAAIAAQQVRLLARYQPEGGFRALNPEDPLYWGVVAQLAAVRLDVMGRRAKFKLGQNRPAATHYQIIAELRKRGRFLGQTLGADQAGAPTAAPVVKALRKAKGIDSDLVPSYMVRPEDQPVDTRSIR